MVYRITFKCILVCLVFISCNSKQSTVVKPLAQHKDILLPQLIPIQRFSLKKNELEELIKIFRQILQCISPLKP
jgi:hypothetical protein